MPYSLSYIQKQSTRWVFQEICSRNIQIVYRKTKVHFHFIEITILHVYSAVNVLHLCRRTPFLKNTYGELFLCIVLNIDVINVKVLSKYVEKLFEIHFDIRSTFSNFIRDFRLVAKYQFSEGVEFFLYETRKRGLRLWYLNCNLKFYIRQAT